MSVRDPDLLSELVPCVNVCACAEVYLSLACQVKLSGVGLTNLRLFSPGRPHDTCKDVTKGFGKEIGACEAASFLQAT